MHATAHTPQVALARILLEHGADPCALNRRVLLFKGRRLGRSPFVVVASCLIPIPLGACAVPMWLYWVLLQYLGG